MKRFGIVAGAVSGVAALAGAAALVLGGALPSNAATEQVKTVAASNSAASTPVRYKTRFFVHYSEGNHAMAVLPSTWRAVELGNWQTRFDDSANNRMIRFNINYNNNIGTVTALNRKIAALKGTRGLHIVGTSTVGMNSTNHQDRLTVSTVVYTYKSGNATRWVATRYVGQQGRKSADVEISTAGSPADSKALGAVINYATLSLALAG
ncbi:hypothetical protein [Kribbella kalugense]|uniref:Uncharacterized protein n=1 Tax=Kribbella kalugense TaxID=2512221 RepID=A0A4R7ZD46_9ACTN|nr:hypothetical protein [Kribbella kalugense]TDW15493.1 hypothetical protein EV650_6975 [Kribbella kalugense]